MYPPKYKHQTMAVALLSQHNVFALIMEQGTGKSRPILEDWLARVKDGRAQDLVILAPKGCYLNWIVGDKDNPSEIDKWIDQDTRKSIQATPWISGGTVASREALENLLHVTKPRILVMNIEALNRKGNARNYLLKFLTNRKVIGVIDESTTIAHEDASRTTFLLYDVAHRFTTRRILSGLVAPESPLDLFTQYKFLDWHIIGQRSFFAFRNRYAITEEVDFRPMHLRVEQTKEGKPFRKATIVVSYRNLEDLNERIMKKSYRVTKDQVLDLPPKIYKFWDVDLTEEQKRIYNDLRDVATAKIASNAYATAKTKLDQLSKMQHVLCGHIKQEDQSLADITELRTDAVVEILHEHTGKAIIWAPYPRALRKIVDRLWEEFGDRSAVGYWGEHDLDERLEARSRIQSDDDCRFIVSNQSVGKFGNTWTSCNLVIYYANSFDNEDRQQSEDRAHRIGQTKYVTYIDLRAKGTLDEKLIEVLRKKITISAAIQGDEFKKWLI